MTAPTAITPYAINRSTGLDMSTVSPTTADATNGNSILNTGNMFVDVHNTNSGSTSHIVTFKVTGAVDGNPTTPKSITVLATKTVRLGPWPTPAYGGSLVITGNSTELTFTAFTMPTN